MLTLLSGILAGFSAVRGMDLDQLVFYHAALRMLEGQLPYSDFEFVQGPLTGIVLLPFFKLAPTGGWAMVTAAIALNCATTLIVYLSLVKKFSKQIALLAGGLTSLWFLPVFGHVYCDPLAFFWLLSSIYFLPQRPIVAGIFVGLSMLTKQNIGMFGLFAVFIAQLITDRKKATFLWTYMALGVVATFTIVMLTLCFFHIPLVRFFEQWIVWSLEFAKNTKSWSSPFVFTLLPYGLSFRLAFTHLGVLAFLPVLASVYLAYWALLTCGRHEDKERVFLLCSYVFSALWCASMLGRLYAYCFFSMGGVMAMTMSFLKGWQRKLSIGIIVLVVISGGMHLWKSRAFSRKLESTVGYDTYPIQFPPGWIPGYTRSVVNQLRQENVPYAYIDDRAMLVSAFLGKAPKHLSLGYQYGQTVPDHPRRRQEWEQRFISKLEADKVSKIIFAAFPGVNCFRIRGNCMQDLELLKSYLEDHFEKSEEYRGAIVLTRKRDSKL